MNGCLVYCFAGLPWISLGNIKCGADLYYILNFNDSNNEKNSLFCLSGNNVAEKRTYSTCIINQNTTSLQVGGAASLRKLAQFSSCLQSSFSQNKQGFGAALTPRLLIYWSLNIQCQTVCGTLNSTGIKDQGQSFLKHEWEAEVSTSQK